MAEEAEDEEFSLKPFRIVEPRMRQLVSTVVPRSLVALEQHQENISRLLAERDWDRVNTEQINATRTAQQLKDHLRTLQELREQVARTDLQQFDSRVGDVEEQLRGALLSYGLSSLVSPSGEITESRGGSSDRHREAVAEDEEKRTTEDMVTSQYEVLPSTVADHSSTNYYTQESWEQLKAELDDLRDIMTALTQQTQSHHSKISQVNDQLASAASDVRAGTVKLSRATRHNIKSYVLPLGGAVVLGVVGALVGGPVGLVAGANIGAAAALTGVAAGTVSGGLLGRKIYNSTLPQEELELEEIKKNE